MNARETASLILRVNTYLEEKEAEIRQVKPAIKAANECNDRALSKSLHTRLVKLCDKKIAAVRFKNVLENPID